MNPEELFDIPTAFDHLIIFEELFIITYIYTTTQQLYN